MRYVNIILLTFVSLCLLLVLLIISLNFIVIRSASDYVFDDIDDISPHYAGLLLGTSKSLRGGEKNLFFEYRIKAAVDLYKTGKIKFIIVSGDNSELSYNEPRDMFNALVRRGVPPEMIVLDYAGFRTYDSVIRSKEVFGQDSILVVSQRFQNERAVYIARKNDIVAVAYNAKDVDSQSGIKTYIREVFAKVKMMLDVYLLDTNPKFLGKKIVIE